MKNKRFLSVILAAVTVFMILPLSIYAGGRAGLGNFRVKNGYAYGQFSDVKRKEWYAADVKRAYECGLMLGSGSGTFNPNGSVKLCEAVTVAARLHSIYTNDSDEFAASDPWYQSYVDYAKENNIIDKDFDDYSRAATRAEFAQIFASALPSEELDAINEVYDGGIPDVSMADSCAGAVYKLYRAGILTGNDKLGTFAPDSEVKRCEVASIISRMINKSSRQKFTSKVVYEHGYDENGNINVLFACIYDGRGRLMKRTAYTTSGLATIEEEYSYYEKGLLKTESSREVDGEFLYSYEYTYNKEGQRVLTTVYDEDGAVDYYEQYEYNSKGQCIRDTTYSADGKMVGCQEFTYGANGTVVGILIHDAEGHVINVPLGK